MKKQKMNKGITLIALIITIIVLLILAVVAISAVTGDGIISHAKNAKSQYSGAQNNELNTLNYLTNWIDNQVIENNNKENQTTKIISFTVNGDEYQAKEGMTWGEWIASEYNTDGFKYEDDCVWNSNGVGSIIDLNEVITAMEYEFKEQSV